MYSLKKIENIIIKLSIIVFILYCTIKDSTIVSYSLLKLVCCLIFASIIISVIIEYKRNNFIDFFQFIYFVIRNSIVFGLGVPSLILLLNYSFHNNDNSSFKTICIEKHTFKPNSEYSATNKVYFFVENSTFKTYISVDNTDYNKITIGDSIILYYNTGLFHFRIIKSYELIK